MPRGPGWWNTTQRPHRHGRGERPLLPGLASATHEHAQEHENDEELSQGQLNLEPPQRVVDVPRPNHTTPRRATGKIVRTRP